MILGFRPFRGFIVLIAAFALAAAVYWWDVARNGEREWRHLTTVLLRTEGRIDPRPVVRWVRPVGIGSAYARPEDDVAIDELMEDLNTLVGSSGVRFRRVHFNDADIGVIFAPAGEFSAYHEKIFKKPLEVGANGMGVLANNEKFEATHGLAFIAANLPPSKRRNVILEEVTQLLGPGNDSPEFPSSVMYEPQGGGPSTATELSKLDRKLVRFVYLYLKPSDDEAAVRRAFDAHWRNMIVPPRPRRPR